MRATLMDGAGDVHVEDVPDARLIDSTDVGPLSALKFQSRP
jgi:hypothetical protein